MLLRLSSAALLGIVLWIPQSYAYDLVAGKAKVDAVYNIMSDIYKMESQKK